MLTQNAQKYGKTPKMKSENYYLVEELPENREKALELLAKRREMLPHGHIERKKIQKQMELYALKHRKVA